MENCKRNCKWLYIFPTLLNKVSETQVCMLLMGIPSTAKLYSCNNADKQIGWIFAINNCISQDKSLKLHCILQEIWAI